MFDPLHPRRILWFICSNGSPTYVVQPETMPISVFGSVVVVTISRWITTPSSTIIPTTTLPASTLTSASSARTCSPSSSLLTVAVASSLSPSPPSVALAPPLPLPLGLTLPQCCGWPQPGFSLVQTRAPEDVGSSNSSSLWNGDEASSVWEEGGRKGVGKSSESCKSLSQMLLLLTPLLASACKGR